MRWPPVSLTIGTRVLVGHVGDAAQLVGGGDAALHLRHDGERAVPLDVGVHPVVDEPGVALVDVLVAPHHPQQRGERPSCSSRPPRRRRSAANTAETERRSVLADRRHQLRLGQRDAGHVPGRGRVLLDRRRPRPSRRSARPGDLHEPQPLPARVASITPATVFTPPWTQRDQVALADAVAVADLRVVGQLRGADLGRRRRRGRTAAAPAPRAAAARGRTPASGSRPCSTSPSSVAPTSRSSRMMTLL